MTKKYLLLIFLSFSLFGCSSIELEAVSTSEEETQRILALGLSHEENLLEANKLKNNHMISVVRLQLINARDAKIQYELDLDEAKELADFVNVSLDGRIFIGSKVSESLKTGVLFSDVDIQNYQLEGEKNITNTLAHKLKVTISYNSTNIRNYSSAALCDQWNRCDNSILELNAISKNASNCSSGSCNYEETMDLKLSDEFLRNSINNGFTIEFFSKRKSNKITVSKAYLMGYLMVAK